MGLAFNFEAKPEEISLPGSLCAFDGARVAGTSRAVAFDQWVGGARVPCAGVSGVAVLPEHRGRGLAGELMRQLLQRRRESGDAVSVLYPANAALYRRLGYEYAGLRPRFSAPVADLPSSRGEVAEMAEGDISAVMACFSRYASAHTGPVESADPSRWASHILAHKGEGVQQRTVVVPGDQGVAGYASYFQEGSFDNGGFGVTCKHLVALDARALRTLLGYFRRFENAAAQFAWHGPPSTGPTGLALSSTAFSIGPALRRWMGRVLDVPRALEARGYPPSVAAEVVVGVEDPLFPANAGPWTLHVEHGQARVAPAPAPAAAGRPLPIGLLSALYTGFATPADLVVLGAMDDDDPRLAPLSALFAGPVPWMPDFF